MICSLLDVKHKEHKWQNGFFCLSWNVTSACTNILNIQTMCSRTFGGKTTRVYWWAGVVGFVLVLDHVSHRRCCLCNEVMSTEEVPPLPQPFKTSSSLYKWCIRRQNPPRRGRWFLTLASPRYEVPASIHQVSCKNQPWIGREKAAFAQVMWLPYASQTQVLSLRPSGGSQNLPLLMGSSGTKCYHLELMLSSETKCYHLGWNVIIWSSCYHLGLNVIIWEEMLSSGGIVIIWDKMVLSGRKCYNLELMLSSGTKCYHLGCNVIIWS